ncbi:hypothetical protein Q1695_015220 [Nippostrongylus brasiliensis]|nr:hypothetical protein Q1695_015220 [Nippostrongylus brasiliensis]
MSTFLSICSCFIVKTESVRALSVDDILPPDSKNDLREAFNAAIKYLSMKGLPRKNTYSVFCDCSSKDFLLKKYGVINRVIKESTKRQLWITGHENGTLRVWSAGDAVMQLLFVIDSRKEFLGFSEEEKDLSDNNRGDSCDTDSSDDDFQMTGEWPPFKKGTVNSESSTREAASANTAKVFSENEDEDVLVAKPVERLIEERGASSLDSPPWMIRCMRFLAIPVMGTAGGTVNSESSTREAASANTAKVFSENEDEDVLVAKPVERLIEERGASSLDSPPWMIRCMRFLAIPVMGTAGICDVLVVGTNGGKMILYAISEQPRAEDVCKLLKTLALRHAAPII